MTKDVKGCSTCKIIGEESYERFQLPDRRSRMKTFYQYDYRHTNGNLFSTIKPTLKECREARDKAIANGTL